MDCNYIPPPKQRYCMQESRNPKSCGSPLSNSRSSLSDSSDKINFLSVSALKKKYKNVYKTYCDRIIKWDYSNTALVDQFKRIYDSLNTPAYLNPKKVPSRFSDIQCPKETSFPCYKNSNIHGNHVYLPSFYAICTQAPLWEELKAFWWTAFSHTELIVDLTNENDDIDIYYPSIEEVLDLSGEIKIECKEIKTIEKNLILYSFEVTENSHKKTIDRLHYRGWPDKGVLKLGDLKIIAELLSKQEKPPIVHCKAGVGRTGTIVTATTVFNLYNKKRINKDNYRQVIDNLILTGREQRGEHFVQSIAQYQLVIQFAEALWTPSQGK